MFDCIKVRNAFLKGAKYEAHLSKFGVASKKDGINVTVFLPVFFSMLNRYIYTVELLIFYYEADQLFLNDSNNRE